MVDTIKFSQMTDGGDLANGEKTPGLLGGENVLFNNPWTFLPSGTTADRPAPSSLINYRLRFNTTDQLYEYYDAVLGAWTQLQESAFTAGPFVIYQADSAIPDGQNLGALADGILKQTITAGVATIDIAVNGVDYYGPGFTGYFQSPAGTKDANGNIVLQWAGVSSAVNYMRFTNSITGIGPTLSTLGSDIDVPMNFATQAAGGYSFSSTSSTPFTLRSGTAYQHVMTFTFPNTANSWDATWQDSSGTVAWLSDVAGTVTSAEGTENQVLVNGNFGTQETGPCIFTTPQDIGLTSTPEFAGAYFGSPTGPQSTTAGLVQTVAIGGTNASFLAASYNNASGGAPTFWTYKSRSTTVGSFVTVQAGDELGRWEAFADTGAAFSRAGDIVIQAEGTISAGVLPGVWTFRTTNAAGAISFAMSINSSQLVTTQSLFSNTTIQAASSITSGQSTGGAAGNLNMYSPTASMGSFETLAANNAGNFNNILTHASTSAARTWTLPDASGTIALGGSTIPSLQGTANQVLVNGTSGTPVTGSAVTLTTPQDIGTSSSPTFNNLHLTGSILGSNSNVVLAFLDVASAVNYVRMTNNIAGMGVGIGAQGADTDVSMSINSKGAGAIGLVTAALTQPILIYSGTSNQHLTRFNMSNTAADRSVTFQDASGTLAFLSDLTGYVTSVSGTANRITSTGGTTPVIDISASYVGQASITTLGTIGTGVWQGTLVSPIYGGTGVNNGVNTLTLAGTLATVGAFASSFTMTGATAVTFPTSGTLATTSQLPSLGNYTFSGNTMSVTSGSMLFTPAASLTVQNATVDPSVFVVSTNASGSPYVGFYRNTSTLIGAVQGGATSAGATGGSGMLYYNGITNGAHYFWTNAVFATLSPLGSNITLGNLTLNAGELHIGDATGGGSQIIDIFSPTANKGLFQFLSADNVGNFIARVTHASLAQTSVFTIPDPGAATAAFLLDTSATNKTLNYGLTLSSVNFGQTTLNNYTQGTFTPTVTSSSPGDLSISYAAQEGFYTRIGRMIQINYTVQFTPTFTTATGTITFGGLPVASAGNNSAFAISTMSTGWTWPAGKTQLMVNTNSGTTTGILQANGTAAATANVSINTALVTGVQVSITFAGVYYV